MKVSVQSSASSSRTPSTTAVRDRPDGRGSDSCYFPGCRKDANCHCEICLASINATLDLLPSGSAINRASRTKLSALRFTPKKPSPRPAPDFESTPPPTPESGLSLSAPFSPPIKSTAKSRPSERGFKKGKGRSWISGYRVLMVLAGLCFLVAVDLGFSGVVLAGFEPKLTSEVARRFGEESRAVSADLKGRLRFLEHKIEGVVGGGVSNCSSLDSVWNLNQEGYQLLLQWRCVIYQSMAEELSIWGSPLKTSGFVPSGLSSRSLTLLSGSITEWSSGKLVPTSRAINGSSWTLGKWSSAGLQLDEDTWVLEYQISPLFEGPRFIPSALEILRLRAVRKVKKLTLLIARIASGTYYHTAGRNHFRQPT